MNGVQVAHGAGPWLQRLDGLFFATGIALDRAVSGEARGGGSGAAGKSVTAAAGFSEVLLSSYLGENPRKAVQADLMAR